MVSGIDYNGYGVWFGYCHPDNCFGGSSGDGANSSLISELMGIKEALRIILKRRGQRNYVVVTDNDKAFRMITMGETPPPDTEELIAKILDTMKRIQGNVTMQLVKSHSGIEGNTEADRLAKGGTKLWVTMSEAWVR